MPWAWSLRSGSSRWYLPTEEGNNQTKKILKGKSVQWLLGKNSKRDTFTDTKVAPQCLPIHSQSYTMRQLNLVATFEEHSRGIKVGASAKQQQGY
jgi:hypothetical protein